MSNKTKTKKWFYLVLIAIPILFFLLLEVFLRIVEYGEDYSTFVVIEEISDQYFFNPKLPEKYFTNTKTIPSVIPDPFDKIKGENTLRVFVFGGSTTAGYPYTPNASFPGIIKRKLEMFYPTYKIEVINLGVSAVNTYFIRDILPDILAHQPDLLIFYSGHNEYYGALGPASTEFISGSSLIINLTLLFRETKIYQLLKDVINLFSKSVNDESNSSRITLMEAMINEKEIPLGSNIYNAGIEQFTENMSAILSDCNDKNVPVLIGNLVSNLRQKPLQRKEGTAIDFFLKGNQYLRERNIDLAREEFIKAKDSDLIKFRAPEEFNNILNDLSKKYSYIKVDLLKGFSQNSVDSIIGYDLMIDHLHPNLDGYQLMAELFYTQLDSLLKINYKKENRVNPESIEKYLSDNFPFTRYDSTLADIKIEVLLNSFPFTDSKYNLGNYPLENFADSIAMQTILGKIGWAAAHLKIFDYHFDRKEFAVANEEIFVLMEDRPFYKSALHYAIPKMIKAGYVRDAKHILVRNHQRYPDLFTSKNLGIINLNEGNNHLANDLLSEAASYSQNDAEVYFNLSRSYFFLNDLESAISSLEKCINIDPGYKGADEIYRRLKNMKKSN